jgi:hypothetical protein
MRRGLALSVLDLVLVTLLLAIFGSSPWAWLAGPVSALLIWWLDCSSGQPEPSPSPSRGLRRAGELGSSPTQG